ncbi:MAG: hypothetical protein KKB21_02690 [Nanoarchaeota archaeon]|nr:hypothetical protein [Nanoarchaeota archaeon]MBU4086462.1 hypothetical protein [Nanoarchaeota archaeon]
MIKKIRAPVRIDFGGGTTDIKEFSSKYGGCVLNAAINKHVSGHLEATDRKVSLEYLGDIPTSSGLGTSGAMTLLWLALISKEKNKEKLCEEVYKISQARELFADGKQDQYASAFGGINFMEFGKKVKITPLKLSKNFVKKLENSLILVYTGKPHYSGDTNGAVIKDLKKGKNLSNLKRIKQIAIEMKSALEKEDLAKFAELLNEETNQREKLHPMIVPKSTKTIIQQGLKNGAVAAKVLGSGGGGSILFFGDKARLKRYFGEKAITFKFDFSGLTWL